MGLFKRYPVLPKRVAWRIYQSCIGLNSLPVKERVHKWANIFANNAQIHNIECLFFVCFVA